MQKTDDNYNIRALPSHGACNENASRQSTPCLRTDMHVACHPRMYTDCITVYSVFRAFLVHSTEQEKKGASFLRKGGMD